MKIALVSLLFAASAFAQAPPVVPTAACGPENISFKVKMDDSRHTLTPPEAGKARVYFIHESGGIGALGYTTMKLGVDGAWVGANQRDSYFSVSVGPGEHHVCATLQSSLLDHRVELVHFTAEAGKTYFYRTRSMEFSELEPIDSDQGKFLIASYPLSVSTPKK